MSMKSKKPVGPLKGLYRQHVCQANQLAAAIYTAADTQSSREMLSQLESGNYSAIVSASINPMDYSSADTFGRDYLCAELMSKFPMWELGIDRSVVARQKFFEVEEYLSGKNLRENFKIVVGKRSTTMAAVMMTAANKIKKILGDVDLDEIHSFFAFGPGASTSMSRRRGDAAYKFGAQRPHLTYNAIPMADALAKAHPTWRFNAEVVQGSRLVTVPKNAKTDRTICIEPDLNMYFQKGIGKVIRRRLNRWGLLKADAQQYNAELAREGSANGRLATVDLSSASDSIHLELLGQLLPQDWCGLVELTRSPQVVLPDGGLHLLRKVSSMGNGYTFELETLFFYALSSAVIDLLATGGMDHRCTVFGDDIIIAVELVPALEQVLDGLGFTLNRKKTFATGPFRESCGKHYFLGSDVSPFYIRSPINSVLRQYWAANTIRRYSRMSWGLDRRWEPCYNMVTQAIPSKFQRYLIPEGYGDGGLVVDWDEARPSRSKDGYDAWKYKAIIPRNRGFTLHDHGTLLKVLHRLEFPRTKSDDYERGIDEFVEAWLSIQACAVQGSQEIFFRDAVLLAESHQIGESVLKEYARREVSELRLSEVPMPQGFKVLNGLAQRWPSFGPWL